MLKEPGQRDNRHHQALTAWMTTPSNNTLSRDSRDTVLDTNTDISPPGYDTVVEDVGGTVPTSDSTMSDIRFRRNKHLAGCNTHEKDTTKHRKVKPINTLVQFTRFMVGVRELVWDLAASLKYRLVQLDEKFNVPSLRLLLKVKPDIEHIPLSSNQDDLLSQWALDYGSVSLQSNSNGWINNVSLRFITQRLCKSFGVFHSECRDPLNRNIINQQIS